MSISSKARKNGSQVLSALMLFSLLIYSQISFPSSARADELAVVDGNGKVRAAVDITGGKSARVKVTLAGGNTGVSLANLSVLLLDNSSSKIMQSSSSDQNGIVLFENVSSGRYTVSMKKPLSSVTLSQVEVQETTQAQQGKNEGSDEQERAVTRAMYVVGAAAIPTAVGLSLSNSGSGGNSDATFSGGDGSIGKGATTTGGVPSLNALDNSGLPGSPSQGQVGAFGSAAPNPGSPSPAPGPGQTTVNPVPAMAPLGSPPPGPPPADAPVPPDPTVPPPPSSS